MKILVVSDTHGNYNSLKKVINDNTDAEVLIHLGDGEDESEKIKANFEELKVIRVKGNCDLNSNIPLCEEYMFKNKKAFITHGHLYGVKSDLFPILLAAKEKEVDILMFGHTHKVVSFYESGICVINPGSLCRGSNTYAIVDIVDDGISVNIKKQDIK